MRKTYKNIVVVLILFLLLLMMSGCEQQEKYHTTDINEYLKIEGHITDEGTDIRSGLFIFPETIENKEKSEYEYYCERGVLDNSYMIYLKTSYMDKEEYEAELQRLEAVSCSIDTSAGTIPAHLSSASNL